MKKTTRRRIKQARRRAKEQAGFDYEKAMRVHKIVLQSFIDGATGMDQLIYYLKKSKYHKQDAADLEKLQAAVNKINSTLDQVGRQLKSFKSTIDRDRGRG